MDAYKSKAWLTHMYVNKKKSEEEIAELCHVNQSTINRWLRKYQIKVRR